MWSGTRGERRATLFFQSCIWLMRSLVLTSSGLDMSFSTRSWKAWRCFCSSRAISSSLGTVCKPSELKKTNKSAKRAKVKVSEGYRGLREEA